MVIRRIPDPATRLAGIRTGEIDIGQVFSDCLAQARAQVVALTVHYGWSYGQGGAIGALRTA